MIIGGSYYQYPLIKKAKQLGYETHVFALEDSPGVKTIADFFYPINIMDKEKILDFGKKINPIGVVSIASDLAVHTVNFVAENLGLISNSNFCTKASTDKYQMRRIFQDKKLPIPKFQLVNKNFDWRDCAISCPVIVKPTDRSGSRGICKVEEFKRLEQALEIAADVSFSGNVLIEEFVEGMEYSMECISYNGEHHILAITEKFTTGEPHYFETMHLQPAQIEESVKYQAINIISKALDALDIKFGASHAEFKVNKDNNIVIIEIGSRMGGDFIGSDLVVLSTGYDYIKMVIDVAVGNPLCLDIKNYTPRSSLVKFILSERDFDILDKVKKNSSKNIYRIGLFDPISNQKISYGSQRYGYLIVEGRNYNECLSLINDES